MVTGRKDAEPSDAIASAHTPWWAVVLALGFSGFVGVVFGFLPARRAANLNPIEALRRE